ncbi:MAG TPA: hypothetical protein VFC39_18690 [Acidobacteriaceae bacterium]|nr:hypothetical protein [Acidobacteriaceae bacterium]
MIDIHPPQHAPMTKREFFVHLFIVILGILIAIGLEQSVEYLHHRHLASEAARALIDERHIDEEANQFNIFATRRHQRDLQHDLVMLHALRAHQPLPPGPFIIQHVSYIYPGAQWQNVHQSGTINYLTGNLAALTYRYHYQDRFLDLLSRSNEELARAASVLRSPADPLNTSYEDDVAFSGFFRRLVAAHEDLPQQEIDAAWATNAAPGNLAALSPAQIDSLDRAVQIALADDDAMLRDCFTIKRNLTNNPVQ